MILQTRERSAEVHVVRLPVPPLHAIVAPPQRRVLGSKERVAVTVETEQLLAVANYYLAEVRRILATKPQLTSATIGEIASNHRRHSLSPAEMVLAHLGSAAVRLATICEIARYRPTENYRDEFYYRSGDRKRGLSLSKIKAAIAAQPHEHLHLLLRDNVAHEEPGIANHRQIAADRFAVLKATTVDACNKALRDIARRVKSL